METAEERERERERDGTKVMDDKNQRYHQRSARQRNARKERKEGSKQQREASFYEFGSLAS